MLLAKLLQKERTYLIAHDDEQLEDGVEYEFLKLLERRKKNEPLAYILGEKEFYGRTFLVSPDVLVPRPETELLVDLALAFLKERDGALSVLDLGAGRGGIG